MTRRYKNNRRREQKQKRQRQLHLSVRMDRLIDEATRDALIKLRDELGGFSDAQA